MARLLLADDSPAIQRLVELTFSQEDIDVTSVGDGEEAIARITAQPPDLVLADIGMPKRSGYEVAAYVKQQPALSKIPVLLLAGAFEPVDEARAAQVRCDGVLVKPFEPQQVIARVRELLSGATGTPAPATAAVPRAVERLAPLKLVEPASPTPVSRDATTVAAPAPTEDSLDNYFDRLDAAFSTLDTVTPVRDEIEPPIESEPLPGSADFDLQPPVDHSLNQPLAEPDLEFDIPTVDRLLGGALPAGPPHRPAPESPFASPSVAATASAAASAAAPAGRNAIADAFAALMAAEQGEAVQPIRLGVSATQPVITDKVIEDVTRRVLERLSSEALRPIVSDVVFSVAERLVREEIERIRRQT